MKKDLMIPKEFIEPIEPYSTEEVHTFLRSVSQRMCDLFKEKDKAYGGSWQQRGVLSAQLNLERKMDRIYKQFEEGGMFKDEQVENIADTLIDNAAYSLMYLWFLTKKSEPVNSQVKKFLSIYVLISQPTSTKVEYGTTRGGNMDPMRIMEVTGSEGVAMSDDEDIDSK